MKKILVLLPVVALLAIGCNSSKQSNTQSPLPQTANPNPTSSNTQQYKNSDYGFLINYPVDFTFNKGSDNKIFAKNTFILEQGTVLASFIYNGQKYSDTNLIGAGVAIGKITPNKTFGCKTEGLGMETVDNLNFYRGTGGTALGSTLTKFDFYKVSVNNSCFEIQMNIVTDANSAKPSLTEEQKSELKNIMNSVALTFKPTK